MRVNPRINEAINEEWLSDKSREAFDGLTRQRLRVPLLRKGADFAEQDWEDVLAMIAARIDKVDGNEIACGIGEFESVENIQAMKDFLNALNCFNYEFRKGNNLNIPSNFRSDFLFNSQIEMVEDADIILLVGVNPRLQAPVLNSRILKNTVNKNRTKVYSIGTPMDLTYPYTHLGNSASVLNQLASGEHPVAEQLKNAKLPMLIVGYDTLTRTDSHGILNATRAVANKYQFINSEAGWNGYNILHRSQGEINALQLGIDFRQAKTSPKVIFLLGCDNNITAADIPKDSFVVYIGSHGDQGAQYADIILPAAAYTERSGTYVNTEGRVQMGLKITEPPGHSRQQWQIFRALSEECGVSLPYDSIEELRSRIYQIAPHLLKYDNIEPTVYGKVSNRSWNDNNDI